MKEREGGGGDQGRGGSGLTNCPAVKDITLLFFPLLPLLLRSLFILNTSFLAAINPRVVPLPAPRVTLCRDPG